jgi:type I restriction enzyme S subunit
VKAPEQIKLSAANPRSLEGNERSVQGSCALRPLSNGWRWVRLRDIAELTGGITKGQKRRSNGSTRLVPYLRVANVQRGYLDLSDIREIEATEKEIEELRLQPGDILFTEGGDRDKLGRGWIWKGELAECIHQNHVFRARLRGGDSPQYISLYGNSAGQLYFFQEGKHTTNLASINLTRLGLLPIPMPLPDEQRRIVAEIEKQFTRLDAGLASLGRIQVALKRYRASVLRAACEGRLVPTEADLARQEGRSYESATDLLIRSLSNRRIQLNGGKTYREPTSPKTAELGRLPEGWAWATFDQISTRVTVGHVGRMKHEYITDGVPFLRSQNVRENGFDPEGLLYIRPEFHAKLAKSITRSGDLAVVRSGSVGITCVIPDTLAEANCADLVLIQRPLAFVPQYGAYYMNSLAKRHVDAGKVGIALTHFNTKSVAALPVPLPPLAEQRRIVAEVERRLSVIEELETAVAANLRRAERLRQSILHRAFSGKL